MHQLSIPQSVIDRVIAKRGRARAFENMEPSRTALVVVIRPVMRGVHAWTRWWY